MLRKIRIVLAALCFCGITLLFLGIGREWWGWLPRLQMLPATMRLIGSATLGNIAVVLGILLVTLLAGRIYCSVICPLGVFQDIVLWCRRTLSKIFPKSKALRKRFRYNKELRLVRYPVAALMIAGIIVDIQLVVSLLGPYSAYGRMVRSVTGDGPLPLIIAAAVTFVLVSVCAWLWGRAYCNTICPVGTVLGAVGNFQIFGIRVDDGKCIKCGACSRACKASCIQEGTLAIDRSRCVDCFDCIDSCKQGAISFGRVPKDYRPRKNSNGAQTDTSAVISTEAKRSGEIPGDSGRRAFIATGALVLGSAVSAGAQNMKVDGGLAELKPKTPVGREPRLVPPGSGSVKDFYERCTACQLCVTHCPNGVLRPSTDLEHFLQPQMGYENGFCRPECTACSEVCPAGAIARVEKDAKTLIHIGTAVVDPASCISATGQDNCGACARHCPMGAITMTRTEDSSLRPVVAEEQCIGCGKCEYLCPVRPESAIRVKGLENHIS